MAQSRLQILPTDNLGGGRTLLLGPSADDDLTPFDSTQTQVVQTFFPDFCQLSARGFEVVAAPEGAFSRAVVFVPRARDAARARIVDAAAVLSPGAELWVDGQKTDGIDAILREIRALLPVEEVHSRAHGKIFRVTIPEGEWLPAAWRDEPREIAPGMVTCAGVFSADGPDQGSQALAALLPEKLPTRIVELGAGWGWLAAQILNHPGVEILHLVEADGVALDCARRNINDPRAVFHWADALDFTLAEPVNGVIMNPPFHDGRAADPRLGVGFIRAAARLLTGAGRLWMVANRHLPYEDALREVFADVHELGGDNRFKILTATGSGRGTARQGGRRK